MSKPTQRTLQALKEQGALCDIVERWLQYGGGVNIQVINGRKVGKKTGVRRDLFGFIDIIALYPGRAKPCGIQSCGTAFSEHKKKILENAYAPIWLRYGDIELWGWRPLKEDGKIIITPRVYKFSLVDWL